MAECDTRKQLLTLIREFAAEKSQGERRLSDLKRQHADLQSQLDAANAELENAKRSKEMIEQDLRGTEVELALTEASIQAQEARTSLLQEEISNIRSVLGTLKDDERASRDDFVCCMFTFNKKIRKFHEIVVDSFNEVQTTELSSDVEENVEDKQGLSGTQPTLKDLEDKLTAISNQMCIKEKQYSEEQTIHNELLQELNNLERRVFLMDAVTKETKELQVLLQQTEKSEKAYASLGKELGKRFACPSCQFNNTGDFEGNLQP